MCTTIDPSNILVRIDKPTHFGIIVPGVEIIQPGFSIIIIPPIADGVGGGQGGAVSSGAQQLTPGVVGVGHRQTVAGIRDPDYIPLPVEHIVILGALPFQPEPVPILVEQIPDQLAALFLRDDGPLIQIILRRDPIGNLFGTISVDIVAVATGGAALRQRRKLPPVLPRQRHAPVAQRIPDGIVGDRLPVVAGQQVLPTRVPVGVAHRLGRRSQRPRRVGVLLLRRDVPSVVVGVSPT